MRNKNKQFFIGIVVILGAVILLGFNTFKAMFSGNGASGSTTIPPTSRIRESITSVSFGGLPVGFFTCT